MVKGIDLKGKGVERLCNKVEKIAVSLYGKTVGEMALAPDGRADFEYDAEIRITGF